MSVKGISMPLEIRISPKKTPKKKSARKKKKLSSEHTTRQREALITMTNKKDAVKCAAKLNNTVIPNANDPTSKQRTVR